MNGWMNELREFMGRKDKQEENAWMEVKINSIVYFIGEVLSFHLISNNRYLIFDRLCGLVVRAPGYGPRGSGSIPGVTRFSKK
jgi:hypothetical protein